MVGVAEHVGHALTYKILTDKKKVIYRSNVRSAEKGYPNLRVDLSPSSKEEKVILSRHEDTNDDQGIVRNIHEFNPNDLIGRTFILDKPEIGEKHRAIIVKQVKDHNQKLDEQQERVKFVCLINNDQYKEITRCEAGC